MVKAQRILSVLLVVMLLLFITGGTAYAGGALTKYTARVDELVDQVAAVLLVGLLLALLVGQLVILPRVRRAAELRRIKRRWLRAYRTERPAFFPAGPGRTARPVPFSLSPDPGRFPGFDAEQGR